MSVPSASVMQDGARAYFERKDINLIMESIMTGLVYEQPEDPLSYIEDCVKRLRQVAEKPSRKPQRVHWDTFIPTDAQENNAKRQERALRVATNAKIVDAPKSSKVVLPALNATGGTPAVGHPNIIFVLGGPGSGKGTQCERLAKEFKLTHLSTGDLLRAELDKGSEIGVKCGDLMKEGKIVPMSIILGLLKIAIADDFSSAGFLIDGFPRAMDQALEFEETIGKCRAVLCFTCPLTVLEARLLERGKTSGRADDNIDTIKKRFKTFEEQSMPVIDFYKKDGRAIVVDSTAPIDQVYKTTRAYFVDMNIGIADIPPKSRSPLMPVSGAVTPLPPSGYGSKAGTPLPPIASARTLSANKEISSNVTLLRGKAWNNIVFVLGGPGCGKGTQCERIANEFKYTHLSAGDLLRAEVATGSARAKELDAIMKEGKIVPMEITLGLLKEAMERASADAPGFLIDGFPRALDQAIAFEEKVAKCKFVLMFDAPEAVLEQRLLKRGETSGRADDNIQTIKKRFKTFIDASMPVIDYFTNMSKCVKISSVPHPDEVYKVVRPHFTEPNIIMVLGGPGSGKGTQCVRLAKEFHLTHLSTGDLLRAEVENDSDIGKECSVLMKEGKIVPMNIILGLLKNAIDSNRDTPGFLIDGFPRAMDQAIEFEKTIGSASKVLFFNCPLDVLEARLLERGKTSGRADDNIDTIRKRFKTFQEESMPVVGYFGSKVLKIESTGTIDAVYNSVRDSLVSDGILKPDPNIIFVLGGPGSGKGTQCVRLAHEFHLTHLSTGDLLRAELEKGSEIGRKCGDLMKEGKIVPMDIILGLLKNAISSTNDTPAFLIDGFPRAMDQAIEFEKTIFPAKKVLFFNCPLDTLEQRLLERGKTSGRADDNLETIRKRFKTFQEESLPVVGHFGSRVLKIESTGTVEQVYADVKHFLIAEGILKPDPNIIFVLGGPGSGKGTQCVRLAKEFRLTHLSTGDLLRAELDKGSEIGRQCGELMKEGKIVPMDIILGLLRAAISQNLNTPGFLIDGFPRAMDQALKFEKTIFPAKKVLFFNCPLNVLEERLLERGKTSGRADDNIDTIRKRFQTFQNESLPVVGHFGDRVLKIESTGTVDEVYADVKRSLVAEGILTPDPNIIFVLGGPGSGKGTQCARLAKEFHLTHLSTGDLLRAELENGSEVGKKCGDLMKEGKIVPMDIILGLLKAAIFRNLNTPGFLIDGFPRAKDQAIEFEKVICPAKQVLFFNCPLEVLEARLLERGKTSGRADDNIDTIRKRFKTFQEESLPVAKLFEDRILRIESTGTVDEVYESTKSSLLMKKIIRDLPFEGSNIVFVLGGPGSGKGTQCDKLVEKLKYAHLSTGDLLRDEVKRGTPLGAQLEEIMREGKMVPLGVTLKLLVEAMQALKDQAPGYLIDGFPRTMEQAVEFESVIGHCKFVLFFDAPNETLTKRLIKRGETSGRADDNLESIKKRLETFANASMPVIKYFELSGRVKRVLADGAIQEITAATLKCFEGL